MTKKTKSKAFEIFEGDYVNIVTHSMVEQVTQTETQVDQIKTPIIIEGFFTDECDDYYYLGSVPETYTQLVKKSSVLIIEAKPAPDAQEESTVVVDKGLN